MQQQIWAVTVRRSRFDSRQLGVIAVAAIGMLALWSGWGASTASAQLFGGPEKDAAKVQKSVPRARPRPKTTPAETVAQKTGPTIEKTKPRGDTPPRVQRAAPAAVTETPRPTTPAEQRQQVLAGVKSWGYQLRLIRFAEVTASPLDLVVIDHALSAGRRFIHEFSPEQIAQAKVKPDGSRRIVLAYLSVGEAERYRFYWHQDWYDASKQPSWLAAMNTVWDGNYLVRFWEPDWQRLIFGSPDSYLQRIKTAGFDGIYIDRADAFSEWTKIFPGAEKAMVSFISNLAQSARANDPGFLVFMQNAEELVPHKAILDAIDGIAKEDLFYGIDHKATANDPGTVEWSLQQLRRAQRVGRKILVVEYLAEIEKAAIARRRAESERFVIHFTSRDLGELMLEAPDRRPLTPGAPPSR